MFKGITKAELWNLKSNTHFSTEFNRDRNSQVCLLSDTTLVLTDDCTTYVWEIGENDLMLTKRVFHAAATIDLLQKMDEEKFGIGINGQYEIWGIGGNLVRTLKIRDIAEIRKIRAIGDFFVYEKELLVSICSFESEELLKKFDNYTLIGSTPDEIFIRNNNKDKFAIEIYALDEEFTFIGILNTQHFYQKEITSIEYCQELRSLFFESRNCNDTIIVGIVTLECKLNFACKYFA